MHAYADKHPSLNILEAERDKDSETDVSFFSPFFPNPRNPAI